MTKRKLNDWIYDILALACLCIIFAALWSLPTILAPCDAETEQCDVQQMMK